MNLRAEIARRIEHALSAAVGFEAPALVAPAAKIEFGDYQANGVMAAAKRAKTNPRQLAEKVLAEADLADLVEKVEVAGPGFINITLSRSFLAKHLAAVLADDRLGAEPPAKPQRVVVDYSAPNIAKEMHVGHLRSTIIGDCLASVLEFLGHEVIRQNHIGDWGTQFGMLIAHMGRRFDLADVRIPDLESYYVEAKKRFESDPEFAEQARRIVTELHQSGPDGKTDSVLRWHNLRRATLEHCYEVYGRLGVWFTPKEWRDTVQPGGPGQVPMSELPAKQTGIVGESFYNDQLPAVVADLDKAGLLTESQGAKCVFLDQFKGKDGEPLPVIVQKSDGAYLYATTDLAAIRYRVNTLHAERVLYVIDSRQSLHLQQVFAVARRAGFAPESVCLEHVAFGTVMGPDRRPFKTREGGTIKLMDLLDEAVRRAAEVVAAKNPDLSPADRAAVARVVGIGAVKYADLSQNRTSDYVFSWEKMLSLDGNTAPYMQYAYARIRSIFRKGGLDGDAPLAGEGAGQISLDEPAERGLAVRLLQWPETLAVVAAEALPNVLCGYLFDLANAFMAFYEACPVLQAEEPLRTSRLLLCRLTARTIRTGLDLLGIETAEQM